MELPHHPLLDVSPKERATLLKAERGELGQVVSIEEARAIRTLWRLDLIKVHDAHGWVPTEGRGDLVARVFDRLELIDHTWSSPDAVEKSMVIEEGCRAELAELLPQVVALRA